MKTFNENEGMFLPKEVRNKAIARIKECLESITTDGDRFIINDEIHYREQPNGKITNCVMNSARFISSKFQESLGSYSDSEGETKIDGQAIDGFINIPYTGTGFCIRDKNRLLEVLHGYIAKKNLSASSIHTLFPMFYGMFVERNTYSIDNIPDEFAKLFISKQISTNYRIGVEFETGNIASSFRAINKLFVLFQKGEIDAGVFVTSVDKPQSATRIWPVSNRNGSFQELRSRNYQEQVSLPLICIGFAPDDFSTKAPFLGKSGQLYKLEPTGIPHKSGRFDIYTGEEGEEILKSI